MAPGGNGYGPPGGVGRGMGPGGGRRDGSGRGKPAFRKNRLRRRRRRGRTFLTQGREFEEYY